jgi:hypothetical protein
MYSFLRSLEFWADILFLFFLRVYCDYYEKTAFDIPESSILMSILYASGSDYYDLSW